MGTPRYWIWAVKPQLGEENLLIGLGRRKDLSDRWKQLTLKGYHTMPIGLYQLMMRIKCKPKYIRIVVLMQCRTLAEARAELLNLRMQNKLIEVHDFGTCYRGSR